MVSFLHTFDIMEVLARKGDCSMNKLFFFDIDGTLLIVIRIYMKSHLKLSVL